MKQWPETLSLKEYGEKHGAIGVRTGLTGRENAEYLGFHYLKNCKTMFKPFPPD
ncbi:MAG: hypothetical protein QXO47_03005 [Thermoproteota archaeon]|nr:hypothetical protein [Candidatus Brockarchaeota archaeon]